MHMYSNEVPELPYYGAFVGGVQRSASDGMGKYTKAENK